MKDRGRYLFLFIIVAIFVSVLGKLFFNIGHGLDITDDSYYILIATYPDDFSSTVWHARYYTELLYWLSGYNLSYFRLVGILLLLGVSIWFSIELFRYISEKFHFSYTKIDKYLFVIPISLSSLGYYKYWLLTPSYNWLALVSIILAMLFLFRIVNRKVVNYNKFFSLDYMLLGYSLSLSFMAKPTTALFLTFLSSIFALYEYKNINLKKSVISVTLLTVIIVSIHIIFLDGGFFVYYKRLHEGMEQLALLNAGHTLSELYHNMKYLMQTYFFEKFYFHQISNSIFYIFCAVVAILYILKNAMNSKKIYAVLMYIILTIYSFYIFRYSLDHNTVADMLWFNSIELLCVNIALVLISILFSQNKLRFLKNMLYALSLVFIVLLGSFAYSFGTNNNIVIHMGMSIIFVVAAILIWNYIFEKTEKLKQCVVLVGVVFSIIIYFIIQNAYEHPYRLETSIKEQNQYVDFLGGIYVDPVQKNYIETLQNIADKEIKKNEKISLIDMTGGTPSANLILNAHYFGEAWLFGNYSGSNKYAYKALSAYKHTKRLRNAWILTAPNGAVSLNLNILKKIGLHFPEDYINVGTLKTMRRNEKQELWMPINRDK